MTRAIGLDRDAPIGKQGTRKFARVISRTGEKPIDPNRPRHSLLPMTRRPDQQMIDDAARRPALWRLAVGFITAFAVLALWVAALIGLRAIVLGTGFVDAAADLLALGANTPQAAILTLLAVAGLGVGASAAAYLWHRRNPRSLIGPGPRTLRQGTIAAATALMFLGCLAALALPFSDPVSLNMAPALWLAWLPLGLAALILQTGGEEILFRGYLQSQLAARFDSRLIPILIPSILFGLAHYVPGFPPPAALTYVLIATLFGILAADLTSRTGSIGAAWGFHLANNALAVLIVAPAGSITGLALWQSGIEFGPEALTSPLATLEVLVLLATWLLIRRVLRV